MSEIPTIINEDADHNAEQGVERKRRDNINDKIQELGTIIPNSYFDTSKEKSSGTKDGKPNKGQILSKSIEYVESLQDKIDENNKKEIELLLILRKLEELKQVPLNQRPSKLLFKNTSAEIELSKIGVGPLAGGSSNINNRRVSIASESPNSNVPSPQTNAPMSSSNSETNNFNINSTLMENDLNGDNMFN